MLGSSPSSQATSSNLNNTALTHSAVASPSSSSTTNIINQIKNKRKSISTRIKSNWCASRGREFLAFQKVVSGTFTGTFGTEKSGEVLFGVNKGMVLYTVAGPYVVFSVMFMTAAVAFFTRGLPMSRGSYKMPDNLTVSNKRYFKIFPDLGLPANTGKCATAAYYTVFSLGKISKWGYPIGVGLTGIVNSDSMARAINGIVCLANSHCNTDIYSETWKKVLIYLNAVPLSIALVYSVVTYNFPTTDQNIHHIIKNWRKYPLKVYAATLCNVIMNGFMNLIGNTKSIELLNSLTGDYLPEDIVDALAMGITINSLIASVYMALTSMHVRLCETRTRAEILYRKPLDGELAPRTTYIAYNQFEKKWEINYVVELQFDPDLNKKVPLLWPIAMDKIPGLKELLTVDVEDQTFVPVKANREEIIKLAIKNQDELIQEHLPKCLGSKYTQGFAYINIGGNNIALGVTYLASACLFFAKKFNIYVLNPFLLLASGVSALASAYSNLGQDLNSFHQENEIRATFKMADKLEKKHNEALESKEEHGGAKATPAALPASPSVLGDLDHDGLSRSGTTIESKANPDDSNNKNATLLAKQGMFAPAASDDDNEKTPSCWDRICCRLGRKNK